MNAQADEAAGRYLIVARAANLPPAQIHAALLLALDAVTALGKACTELGERVDALTQAVDLLARGDT